MKQHIEHIRHRIDQTALACGRNPSDVRLVAVSKTVSADTVKTAIDAGVSVFGENYIQEAVKKIEEIADDRVSWHFIGHLQSNKAKYAVRYFDLIHSVDSLKLAAEIDKQACKINKIQSVLVQINISMESTKSGVAAEDAVSLVNNIHKLDHLSVNGLMTLPPYYNQPEKVRPYFRHLALIKDQIEATIPGNIKMKELSMGMTGDFEVAIEEGATLVRIGTAIFGERL